MNGQALSESRIAAILLIAGGLVFLPAGILYTGRAIWKWPIGETRRYLLWERGLVIVAVLLTTFGLVVLADLLQAAGDRILARLGMTAFLIATIVLIVAETSYLQDRVWSDPQVIFFVILAFLAQAAFGFSLLSTGLVASWAGWATVIWNLAALLILLLASPRDIYYPVAHHVAPFLIGIALLLGS